MTDGFVATDHGTLRMAPTIPNYFLCFRLGNLYVDRVERV